MTKNNKNKLLILFYCFIIAFVILMFTSKNSFLYPFNDWVDANAFFTVGKGMFKGLVPYRDIFEQKGPFLYLIYGAGSLISYTSFIGIFILEAIAWTIGLYFLYKTARLFLSNQSSLIIIPLFTALITTSFAFTHGGSAEEFMLPFFMITLYYFFKHFKVQKLNKKEMFINGIIAGLVLLTKYTLLGFWIGFTLAIFIDYIIDKNYRRAIIYPLILLSGMIIIMLPFITYFGLNGAISDFFYNYFLVNITSYGERVSIFNKIGMLFKGFFLNLLDNPIMLILLLLMLIFIYKLNTNKRCKILLIVIFILTIFFVYFGLKFYRYYLLFVLFFSSIALILLFIFIDKYLIKILKLNYVIILGVSLICCGLYSYYFANYKSFREVAKEDLFQYEFAEIINNEKDATLVNMGHLDCGVYTLSGKVPVTYYFEKQNIDYDAYPDNLDAFKKYIQDKKTTFIVYYKRITEENLRKKEPELFENYDLIKMRTQEFEGYTFHAFLFIVKEN